MLALVIRGGRVVTPCGVEHWDIALAGERIVALTASWWPPPQVVGVRDGLLTLGDRENTDFVPGVRFTQGNLNALGLTIPPQILYQATKVIQSTCLGSQFYSSGRRTTNKAGVGHKEDGDAVSPVSA